MNAHWIKRDNPVYTQVYTIFPSKSSHLLTHIHQNNRCENKTIGVKNAYCLGVKNERIGVKHLLFRCENKTIGVKNVYCLDVKNVPIGVKNTYCLGVKINNRCYRTYCLIVKDKNVFWALNDHDK